MFTSDIDAKRGYLAKTAFVYLPVSLFAAVFGAVYEHFSHEVYSGFMIYAFLFPLAGGALVFAVLSCFPFKTLPGRLEVNLYNSGIAALTVGSLVEGALEIYGTTSALIPVYWVAGGILAGGGALIYLLRVVLHGRG